MAYKIGIVGLTNTGKSFSRKTLRKGEDVFVLSPTQKALHIRDSDGNPLKPLNVATDKSPSLMEIAKATGTSRNTVVYKLLNKSGLSITGNYFVMKDLKYLEAWLQFIDKQMPHIKILIMPDFTHYISEILSNKEFIQRKSGGEAFQRFWELAAEALNNFITSIDELREDLLVVTEYHCEYDEAKEIFEIYVPGGKMLKDKFLPDSYYDVLLYTHVLEDDGSLKQSERYKFVTHKTGKYNARCLDLFEDTFIPNNLQLVVDKVSDYIGLKQ